MTSTAPVHASVSPPTAITEMTSYAVDAWFDDQPILVDEPLWLATMREACVAGDAVVLGDISVVFPNGGVAAVLLLSQSHLSVRTWPASGLATVDLLTCGRLHGERIIDHLRDRLRPSRWTVVRTIRDVH
jgi:S-adenosylmethionine decarboxylase